MEFRSERPCPFCGVMKPLSWQTITKNGLTVHNVPIYACPKCGEETLELRSACIYDDQVFDAYEKGLSEITLDFGERPKGG